MVKGPDPTDNGVPGALQGAVSTILTERRAADEESIRSLWRVGDAVLELRATVPAGSWRRVLADCAARVGMHPASLDDAARAAFAFPPNDRRRTLALFAQSRTVVTRSHVIAMARVTPLRRRHAMYDLLNEARSVQELRSCMHTPRSVGAEAAGNGHAADSAGTEWDRS